MCAFASGQILCILPLQKRLRYSVRFSSLSKHTILCVPGITPLQVIRLRSVEFRLSNCRKYGQHTFPDTLSMLACPHLSGLFSHLSRQIPPSWQSEQHCLFPCLLHLKSLHLISLVYMIDYSPLSYFSFRIIARRQLAQFAQQFSHINSARSRPDENTIFSVVPGITPSQPRRRRSFSLRPASSPQKYGHKIAGSLIFCALFLHPSAPRVHLSEHPASSGQLSQHMQLYFFLQ